MNARQVASNTISKIKAGGVTMRATGDGVLIEPPGGAPVVIPFVGDPNSAGDQRQYRSRVADHVALVRRRLA